MYYPIPQKKFSLHTSKCVHHETQHNQTLDQCHSSFYPDWPTFPLELEGLLLSTSLAGEAEYKSN